VSEDPKSWNDLAAGAETPIEPEAGAADIAAMGFEQALAELERIVQELERGQLELDAAIAAYERGTRLRLHCEAKLREAQLRVERITLGENGVVGSKPADLD
jgi:exodeoxyribonuclease VII small subunit